MWRRVCLCLLLLAAAAVRAETEVEEDEYEFSEDEIEERAFLVIEKKVLEKEVPDGTNVTVVLTLRNAGTRAAAKIVVEDAKLPEGVDVLSKDAVEETIEQLSPGSSLAYRTVVRPTKTGLLVFQPTTVKYAPSVGSIEVQVGHSTSTSVTVLTTNEYLVTKVLLLGSYVTLGLLKTRAEWMRFGLVAAVVVLFVTLNYLRAKLTKARKDIIRRRATEFIEKSK